MTNKIASRLDFEYIAAFVLGLFMFWLSGVTGGYLPVQYLSQNDLTVAVISVIIALLIYALGMGVFAWSMLGHNRRAAKPALLAALTVIAAALLIIPAIDQTANNFFNSQDTFVVLELFAGAIFGSFYVAGWFIARRFARKRQ